MASKYGGNISLLNPHLNGYTELDDRCVVLLSVYRVIVTRVEDRTCTVPMDFGCHLDTRKVRECGVRRGIVGWTSCM